MKTTIITLLVTLISFSSFAQKTLHFDDLLNEDFYRRTRNMTAFDEYVSSNGQVFSIGQRLKIGTPENPENVYDDPFLGKKYGNFTYVLKSVGYVMTMEKTFSGETCTISGIFALHEVFRRSPLYVSFACVFDKKIENYIGLSITRIEKAIKVGEIINLNAPMDRTQAIAKLKEQKELLDLGIISAEDYEKLKKELTPIILNQ